MPTPPKLDSVQTELFRLQLFLKDILNEPDLKRAEEQILKINALYKHKKEIVRLSKVYFLYNNLSTADKLKYANILKRALSTLPKLE